MENTQPMYLYHCMLFHFQLGINATVAINKICDVYENVLNVNKCQCWFRKLFHGDFDLSVNQSGCPVKFDNDALKSLVKTDPKLSIQEIASTL